MDQEVVKVLLNRLLLHNHLSQVNTTNLFNTILKVVPMIALISVGNNVVVRKHLLLYLQMDHLNAYN